MVSLFMLIPFWRALCIAKLTGRTTRASRYLARNTARSKFSLRLCRVMRGWCLRSPDFFGGLLKTSLPGDPFYIHIECTSILLYIIIVVRALGSARDANRLRINSWNFRMPTHSERTRRSQFTNRNGLIQKNTSFETYWEKQIQTFNRNM